MGARPDVDDELRELIGQARLAEALALLERSHGRDLVRYVGKRLPPALADDVCQEVWLAARAGLPGFRGDCPARVWLIGLARRKVIDVWRQSPELTTLPSSLAVAPEAAALLGLRTPSTPTGRLARAQVASALEAALAALDETDRELIALRFLDDLKPREIAQVTGLKANTVSQRIVRAVRRLRDELAGQGGG